MGHEHERESQGLTPADAERSGSPLLRALLGVPAFRTQPTLDAAEVADDAREKVEAENAAFVGRLVVVLQRLAREARGRGETALARWLVEVEANRLLDAELAALARSGAPERTRAARAKAKDALQAAEAGKPADAPASHSSEAADTRAAVLAMPDAELEAAYAAVMPARFAAWQAAQHSTGAGQGEPGESAGNTGRDSPAGFLGGAALADALGVHPTQRDAFFQQLMRQRMGLGDDCWHEVRDPRPNSPRFLYRADSTKLRDLAADYRRPKLA